MGRKRTRDFDLPCRLYRRGARFYYVTHERRWIPLGTDLAAAKRKWADFECLGQLGTVSALIDRYLADHTGNLAPSTLKRYRAFARTIENGVGRSAGQPVAAAAASAMARSGQAGMG
jgi:hypothetical protein